jgi:cell division protein FtsZ
VDFADVRSVMSNAGSALMGIGWGLGETRAVDAARGAINSPLLELSIAGATGLLFNITGGNDLSMFEIDEAAKIITEACDPNANIIFGTTIDENYAGNIKITVVATGFDGVMPTQDPRMSASRAIQSGAAFGRRPLPSQPSQPYPAAKPAGDDLDVPAFLRNKVK